MGEVRVPGTRLSGRRRRSGRCENFPISRHGRSSRAHDRTRSRAGQGGRRPRERASSACSPAAIAEAIAGGRSTRSPHGQHDARVPDRRLPDRLRHVLEHEHERGARDARGAATSARPCTRTTTSTRRSRRNDVFPTSVHVAVDPGRSIDDLHARRSTHLAVALEAKAERVRGRRQVRPHPPDGRHPGDPRARSSAATPARCAYGIERVQAVAPPRAPRCPSAAPPWARASTRRPASRRSVIAAARRRHRAAASPRPRDHFEAQAQPRRRSSRHPARCAPSRSSLTKINNDLRWMGSGPTRPVSARSTSPTCSRARRSCPARSTRSCPRRR